MNINEIKESKLYLNGIYNIFLPQAKGGKLKEFEIPPLWFQRQQNTSHFSGSGYESRSYKAKRQRQQERESFMLF
jgi:hypothetical protein